MTAAAASLVPSNERPRTRAHGLIPGGAHTYSKGDDQFPAIAPATLERGDGARVWDADGREYLDWCMGLRAMSLGYGHKAVNRAAIEQIGKGSNFGRPSSVEADLAQDLVDLVPGMEMVKFAKNGSTVTTAAVKLARAHTGRDMVAVCRDHPFFSYDDWFIGSTVCDAGIPEAMKALTTSFRYNRLDDVEALFARHPGQIACVILEPATWEPPKDRFLHRLRDLCHREGAVFILDEMVTGFRFHRQGAQVLFDVEADLCTLGKGMGNGFSIAALLGKGEFMEAGGLFHGGRRVFLISTTHGAENHSLAAARAVIRAFAEDDVTGHMARIGGLLIEGLNVAATEAGLGERFSAFGFACNPYYVCRGRDGEPSAGLKTLFMQELVKAGILMPYIAPAYAHTEVDVARTVEAARKAFAVYAQALDSGWEDLLVGPPVQPVFRAFN